MGRVLRSLLQCFSKRGRPHAGDFRPNDFEHIRSHEGLQLIGSEWRIVVDDSISLTSPISDGKGCDRIAALPMRMDAKIQLSPTPPCWLKP